MGDADALAGVALGLPNGLGASAPNVRAGGGDMGLDEGVGLDDPNAGRDGDDEPNVDAPVGVVVDGDDGAAGFIRSPKRVGGGSCLAGAAGDADDVAVAGVDTVEGGGTGERNGAGAALADTGDAALMVAAAGWEDGAAGLSAGFALSSLLPPRLNKRPMPPATAPAVTAAAVVAIDEGLLPDSGADSALAVVGAGSAGLRPGSILPKRPAIPAAGLGTGADAGLAGRAALSRSTGTISGVPKPPISFLPPMLMAMGRSARMGSPAGKAASVAVGAGKAATTGVFGKAGAASLVTLTAGGGAA